MNATAIASELSRREKSPAYVKFVTEAKHLVKQSEREGRYIAKDVDMVEVRQIGGTDSVKFEVEDWLQRIRQDVAAGRLEESISDRYAEMYRRWKNGQELPVEGTPIRTWPVISPAQAETCCAIGVRTVEELAELPDEGLRKLGMGGVTLKQKAKDWIAAGNDKGKVVQELATMKQENAQLHATVETLSKQVAALKAAMEVHQAPSESITASELLEDEKPKRGRK